MGKRSRSPGPVRYGPTASKTDLDVEDWHVVDLNLANFHQKLTTNYSITNPAGGGIQIKRTASGTANYGGTSEQDGPCLIYKQQISPRLGAKDSLAGVTDNRWRHGECQLTVAMRVGTPSSDSGNGRGLGVGPGFVFLDTDYGSGATLVSNDPAPPFEDSTNDGSYYFGAMVSKGNNDANVNWNRAQKGGGAGSGVNWYDDDATDALGSAGQVDTVVVQMDNAPSTADSVPSPLSWWYTNSRVNRDEGHSYGGSHGGSPYTGASINPRGIVVSSDILSEGRYVYIAIFGATWNSGTGSDSSLITIEDLRYKVSRIKVGLG